MYLEDYIHIINGKLKLIESGKRIGVWGAAEHTAKLLQYTLLSEYGINCVMDKKLCGSYFFGQIVQHPDEVDFEMLDCIIISSFFREKEIKRELLDKYHFKGKALTFYEDLEQPFYQHISKADIKVDSVVGGTLIRNSEYKDKHAGERVFILCTGPSIREMDLMKLKKERTIAVSSFYLHKDCRQIKPDYYCVPTFEDFITKENAIKWLREMKEGCPYSHFFLSIHEKEYIEVLPEYKEKEVSYISFSNLPDYYDEIDLTQSVLNVQSVAIMCLELAIYMGFKKIYLVGTEHSELITGKYSHFYKYSESIISKEDSVVDETDQLLVPFKEMLCAVHNLWKQYALMKRIAEKRGIEIYNATIGGSLDLFERVNYEGLF